MQRATRTCDGDDRTDNRRRPEPLRTEQTAKRKPETNPKAVWEAEVTCSDQKPNVRRNRRERENVKAEALGTEGLFQTRTGSLVCRSESCWAKELLGPTHRREEYPVLG